MYASLLCTRGVAGVVRARPDTREEKIDKVDAFPSQLRKKVHPRRVESALIQSERASGGQNGGS